jgi:5-methylcytosine-specific restriction endonuclease McrA
VPRLQTLKPRIATLGAKVRTQTTASTRITGSTLQARRKRCWLRAGAKCERCGRVVGMTQFELDHKVPLYQGGPDTDENCQVLCKGDTGCHAAKTREDMQA